MNHKWKMPRNAKEALIEKMVRRIWHRNGGAALHGTSFEEASESDSFGYRELVVMIIHATLRTVKKEGGL